MTEQNNPVKLPIIATFMQVLLVMKERYIYFFIFSIPFIVFIAFMFIFGESLAPQKNHGFMAFVVMTVLMLVISSVAFHRTFIMNINNVNTTAIFLNIIGLPVYYFMARWLLVLPATSVDDEEASMTTAWYLSEVNGWHLEVLVFLLPLTMNMISLFLFSQEQIVLTVVGVALYVISMLIGVGVLSLSCFYLKLNTNQSLTIEI